MTPVSIDTRHDGVLDVVLRGEIDYTNAAAVTQTVTKAVDQVRPTAVRVDLTEVTFLDSSGIGVLITGMKAAREIAADYRVRGPNPKVLDQLRITGLAELFPVEPAEPPAVAG
jgi:stage II sporulation protein AA (anti-sigma F factor antagonist)